MSTEIKLPRPHNAQKLILDSKARFKVVCCGRRFGKSVVAMIAALNKMFSGNGKAVAYVTPEYSLAKDFFNSIVDRIPKHALKAANISDLQIDLSNKSKIKFFSGEAINNMRGREFDLVIVDEAAFIPDLRNAWFSVIRPTLSNRRGEALFIGTPRGMNFFYILYLKGKNKEDGFESFHYPSNANPFFPDEEFEEAKLTTPEAQFKEEYLAEPMANQANPFGDSVEKNMVKKLSDEPTIVFGVDVATTNDYTVVIGLDTQGRMTYFDRFRVSWTQTHNRLLKLPKDVLMVVDATGVGDAAVERLALERPNVKGFKFTATSKPEIMYRLIGAVEKGEITYNEITANEMRVFEYEKSSTGHIKFNAQKGFHDDCVCALAMANYYRTLAAVNLNWRPHFI